MKSSNATAKDDYDFPKLKKTSVSAATLPGGTTTTTTTTTSFVDNCVNDPYRLPIDRIASLLQTDIVNGLNDAQVTALLKAHGPNHLGEQQSISYLRILAHQVFNAMILVLIISMVIALAIKDWISGGVIGFVLFVNIFVGFLQEVNAEKTMDSLKNLSSPSARVSRNGIDLTISADQVVPGDVVHISVGDTIPADLRLIGSMNLETDEALLTGESLPVAKDHTVVYNDNLNVPVPVGDRLNLAYCSSVVSKGRGIGIVYATGLNSEIGKIAKSLQGNGNTFVRKVDKTANRTPSKREYVYAVLGTCKDIIGNVLGVSKGTPLQIRLAWLAISLFWLAVVFAIVVMASQKMHVTRQVAIYAICVALSMIPSSLVVVLTITMAVGAKVMIKKNVIVRKLDSLEALGGIDDICSDKTGTLTQGKMIVKKAWVPSVGTLSVGDCHDVYDPTIGEVNLVRLANPATIAENSGTAVDNEIQPITLSASDKLPSDLESFLLTGGLANIASLHKNIDGSSGDSNTVWKANGDATEIAIRVFTSRLQLSKEVLDSRFEHVNEFPFDSSVKRMSAIYTHRESANVKVYTKGAVERVLECCEFWQDSSDNATDGDSVPLTKEAITLIETQVDVLSSQGLRVLAFASRDISELNLDITNRQHVESCLSFQGLVGIYDPPRVESASSVARCHHAGINVRMLTGDHIGTAKAIAQEVGILPQDLDRHYNPDTIKSMIMTADQFDSLNEDEIDKLPVLPLVIARCAPQTKVRMIEALHRRGKFAAMTGDGVNDSPSLKIADVGVAMGLNGSDVAKDASDIVLTDDNFSSILNAVEEGRRMSANIQRFVLQLLAENVAQAFYLMIGLAFIDKNHQSVFPLSPVEVLWIIMVTSCFPSMGLGMEKKSEDILDHPPNNEIFTKEMLLDLFVYGLWMSVCCILSFVIIVVGVEDMDLGYDCNNTNADTDICDVVFRGRSASFAVMTWCALLLAWECLHFNNSLFRMRPGSVKPWWKQTGEDLWENQFLFWSVVCAFASVFPVVYIPVINTKVFMHKGITYEWGISFALSILFIIGAELWKWCKRIYKRKKGTLMAKTTDELMLERDPFSKYGTIANDDASANADADADANNEKFATSQAV